MINVAQAAIEFSIIIFYVFVLFIIITSRVKNFRNAFYSMFVATGIADATSLFANCLIRVNSELYLGEEFRLVLLILIMVSGTTFIAHMLGNMFITINRYSAVCLMHNYDKIWARRNVWIVIGIQYAVSFMVYFHTIRTKMVYIRNANGTFSYGGLENDIDKINRFIYVSVCLVYALVSVSLNARLLMEGRRLLKMSRSRHGRHERGLLLNAFLVFIFTMLMCTQQVMRGIAVFINDDNLNTVAKMHFYWINDAMISVPPLSLLLLSTELRRDIVNFFTCKRDHINFSSSTCVATQREFASRTR
ncbi:hypothetical protein GCK32_002156 [Trichostrongylus colubriformis]|uniref:Uncharacterized protein n=1 Tax=Trichostrongylus colubriformis TaxID=6319 RepID=A0AAN8IZB9_TRICO